MMLAIADTYLAALSRLDRADAKRAVRFLEKLQAAPSAASLKPEIAHDGADRNVRSFRVTRDLRAIAYVDGDVLAMIHVARHDRAYEWLRTHCVVCVASSQELAIVRTDRSEERHCLDLHDCTEPTALSDLLERHGLSGLG